MNRNQINKSRMFGSVDLILDQHASIFSQLQPFVDAQQELKKGILSIGEYRQVQEANNTGLTKVKVQLRSDVIKSILQFSAALKSYAIANKNNELKAKSDYSDTDLIKSPDPRLYDIGILLMGLTAPLNGGLTTYFIGEAELQAMDKLLAAFKFSIPQRRAATSKSKTSTVNIREVFNELDQLLKGQIDVYMQLFRFSQPDFFNAYRNARSIVDYTGRGATKPKLATSV